MTNTASKRFSMMGFLESETYVVPDGTIDQGDRQTFLSLYSGILAEEAIIWTTQPPSVDVWTEQTASTDIWTEQTASIDTWTPQ